MNDAPRPSRFPQPRPPREFPIGAEEKGQRLDRFLRSRFGWPRPLALKATRKGWVRVNGRRAKANLRLQEGDAVKITNYALPLPEPDAPAQLRSVPVPASWVQRARAAVRHRAQDLVVAVKPSGVAVHRGSDHPWGWDDALGRALEQPLVPVGRLDRDTSGLLALAPTPAAARALFAALRAGSLRRTYTALVAGRVDPPAGCIDRPLLRRGPPGRQRMAVDPNGSPARTHYRTVRAGRLSLLELTLETGRKHQIRAHLRALGHPLLGDPRYGSADSRRWARVLGLERLFLHAGELCCDGGEGLPPGRWSEPLPPPLVRVLDRATARGDLPPG